MVRMKGLEPSRLAALVPKTSVSTNSTTSAKSVTELYTKKTRFENPKIGSRTQKVVLL